MRRRTGRTRLDTLSLALLIGGVVFFGLSATFYLLSVIAFAVNDGPPPLFTLGEIGTYLGIGGMIIVPLYIIAALLATWREKKTGNDIDDHSKRRTAERGGPDRRDERPDLHHGTSWHGQDGSAPSIRENYEEEARGRGLHGHRRS